MCFPQKNNLKRTCDKLDVLTDEEEELQMENEEAENEVILSLESYIELLQEADELLQFGEQLEMEAAGNEAHNGALKTEEEAFLEPDKALNDCEDDEANEDEDVNGNDNGNDE